MPECAIVFITPDCRIMKIIRFGKNIISAPAAPTPTPATVLPIFEGNIDI